ncbi:hypothetical protein LPB19_02135 [Marinobacter salinisoli]|uniref:Solute-binding protein family 3/N-terminal domain-containing protein n=1 Tax=Marinobacter salinisoli TaxID=2769486 RepID=A0ABX7MSS5_9GAMM|nr:hypothetical protein [Marinobacter salinisoli]QSP95243.1 hypothetical protein LPB19_02135 [Marinobacter salinisoli]
MADCSWPAHQGFGIDADFLSEVVKHAGMQPKLAFYTSARLQRELQNGRVDATAGLFHASDNGRPRYRYVLYDLGGETRFYMAADQADRLTRLDQLAELKFAMVARQRGFREAGVQRPPIARAGSI